MRAFFLPALLLAASLPFAVRAEEPLTRVEPKETDELLANPGMGWQTFHQFNHHDRNLRGLPTASAYFRFYWREIEPADGKIDFARLDGMLAHGRDVGQKVALRVMCTGSDEYADSPLWLRDAGCKGREVQYGGRKHWLPDFSDPVFREKHGRLIRELGKRYDGHAGLDMIDIGSAGLWGEWHMADVKDAATGQPVGMPSVEVQNALISEWAAAFPKTPKVVLIGSDEGMARAVKEGLGWRADCFGDMGVFSKNWNHMEKLYPEALAKAGAHEAWKRGPVAFESCMDMRKWAADGWDIRAILDYGLAHHASYMNNKSAPLPDGIRPEVERFLRKLGYRLVVRSLGHPPRAQAGGPLGVKIAWENVGVAPPYFDYRVALRLRGSGAAAKSVVLASEESIRGWLPGARSGVVTFPLPRDMAAGSYDLALGIVEPGGTKPAVRLAIERRDAEGWYPLSRVEVATGR